ncbi:MAG: peptidoglycan-associated lipoprotein [Kordiimonas sp.]|nr:peptidoglycan-associated lipoprotein [Kordiimonas sp.]
MGKKLWVVIATAFLLTACANTQDSALESAEPVAEQETPPTEAAPTGDVESSEMVDTGPVAGSQEDLDGTAGSLVYFGFDRYDLSAEARAALQAQAQWLQSNDNVNVTVEGHCDERGTREYNLALGDRRATAVKNYLVALGVSPSRVKTISYGKERPAVLGQGESAWAQNRRGYTRVD